MVMQVRRTLTVGATPTGLAEGQFSVGMADTPASLWAGVPTSVDPSGSVQLLPGGYVTSSALTTALSGYVSTSALTTTLLGYVSTSALTTALGDYLPLTGGTMTGTVAFNLGGGAAIATNGGYITTDGGGINTNGGIINTNGGYIDTRPTGNLYGSSVNANLSFGLNATVGAGGWEYMTAGPAAILASGQSAGMAGNALNVYVAPSGAAGGGVGATWTTSPIVGITPGLTPQTSTTLVRGNCYVVTTGEFIVESTPVGPISFRVGIEGANSAAPNGRVQTGAIATGPYVPVGQNPLNPANWASYTNGAGTYAAAFYWGGNALAGGGTLVGTIQNSVNSTAYGTASDGRLKRNDEQLDESYVGGIIDGLRPVRFEFIVTPSQEELEARMPTVSPPAYGFIAQEANEVFPAAVVPGRGEPDDADFIPWMMDYSKIVPILVAELQSLRARVAALEAR